MAVLPVPNDGPPQSAPSLSKIVRYHRARARPQGLWLERRADGCFAASIDAEELNRLAQDKQDAEEALAEARRELAALREQVWPFGALVEACKKQRV